MIRVHFTDGGQDFYYWDIEENGTIVDSQPFQASLWCKVKCTNFKDLKVGGLVEIVGGEDSAIGAISIKYPIEKIERDIINILDVPEKKKEPVKLVVIKPNSNAPYKSVREVNRDLKNPGGKYMYITNLAGDKIRFTAIKTVKAWIRVKSLDTGNWIPTTLDKIFQQ